MYRPLTSSVRKPAPPRRGALLIAVLGLLTLLAIFALFFVFYADAEATGARIHRESEGLGENGPPNDYAIAAFNSTLRSILFDDFDNPNGVMNPLRGHGLNRSMYGWNGTFVGASPSAPFSGIGTFHENAPHGQDRAGWINYSAPYTIPAPSPQAGTYWLDPEWTGYRVSAEINPLLPALPLLPGTIAARPQSFVPKNAPYTYPDLKDLILASLSPATGEVLVPSLHRNWLFNATNPNQQFRLAPWNPADNAPASPTATALNTDWVTPEGRTRILRPRPVDQLTPTDLSSIGLTFPIPPGLFNPPPPTDTGTATPAQRTQLFTLINNRIAAGLIIPYPPPDSFDPITGVPTSYSGDVKNLMGSVGVQRNDSILIDIGLPPRKWNGKWIKPLASILLSDLDGLVNLNVHGNVRNGGNHGSYAGFGAHEVNLNAAFGNSDEANNVVRARYGVPSSIPYWQPSTAYSPGNVVFNAGNFYRCVIGGTSAPGGPGPNQAGTLASPVLDGAPPPSPPAPSPVGWQTDFSIGAPRNGASALLMNRSGGPNPLYSATNFDAGANGTPPRLPDFPGNAFSTNPIFPSMGIEDNHPLMWNPNDWPSGVTAGQPRRTYPLSELKRFSLRYGADLDWLRQTDTITRSLPLQPLAGHSLISNNWTPFTNYVFGQRVSNGPNIYFCITAGRSGGFPGPSGGGAGIVDGTAVWNFASVGGSNSYRLNDAHARRALTTPMSSSFDLPGFVGNFGNSPPLGTLALAPGQYHPTNIAFNGMFAGGGGNDFVGPNDWRNPKSIPAVGTDPRTGVLGAIDLNRPLSDYRNSPGPLHPSNMGNAAQAWADRHNLARDIFGRLILATGANATVYTSVTSVGPMTYQPGDIVINANPVTQSDQYNALRYLAQLAANIVDITDPDDISTGFIWNPTGVPTGVLAFETGTSLTTTTAPGAPNLQTQWVFGVEKPRLVLNEAYSEAVNDPNDPNGKGKGKGLMKAANDGGIRFWVELMNPTATAYSGAGPIGTPASAGATRIRYDVAFGDGTTYSPYRLEIARAERGANRGYEFLSQPQNVTGQFGDVNGAAYAPDVRYDFTEAGATNHTVGPNNGVHNPGANPTNGILLVGPNIAMGAVTAADQEFDPVRTNAPTWANMIAANPVAAMGMNPATGMQYTLPNNDLNMLNPRNGTSEFRRNIILLRRLANPYQPESGTNPYITVDFMDYVYTNDGVFTSQLGPTQGGEVITDRFSTGKVQPYAGYGVADPANLAMQIPPTYSFPKTGPNGGSFVLKQVPNPPNGNEPQHTFGHHNGRAVGGPGGQSYSNGPMPAANMPGETLMAPFDWFVHYDRPLVNQLELLSLQSAKPHEVTQYSLFNTAGTVERNRGLTPWLGILEPPNFNAGSPGFNVGSGRTNNGLFRAMETLRVKPWMYGSALGGKVHGKINVNTIQDHRILHALLDPSSAPWSPGTPYQVGEKVTNSGSIYVCVIAGTSATPPPPPTGPTGTGSGIPDGSVFWNYVRASGGTSFHDRDVDNLWFTYMTSTIGTRTLNSSIRPMANGGAARTTIPGPTYDDVPNPHGFNPGLNLSPPFDRPFRPFGAAEVSSDLGNTVPVSRFGSGLRDTLLRSPIAWTPNTPYPAGQRVDNGPNSYVCTAAGTSGAAPGPNAVGLIPPDGTVMWQYVGAAGMPLIWSLNPNVSVAGSPHPYQQAEMARKMFNNATTTSNAFGVTVTIVFHEVRMDPATNQMATLNDGIGNRFAIGKEVFKEIPGDLRQQFFAVVDRSNIVLNTSGTLQRGDAVPTSPYANYNADRMPFNLALEQLVPAPASPTPPATSPPYLQAPAAPAPGTFNLYLANIDRLPSGQPFTLAGYPHEIRFYSDGKQLCISAVRTPNLQIFVGAGSNLEQLTVNYVNEDGSLNVSAPSKQHAAGELVSNFVTGNPGPNPFPGVAFDALSQSPNNPYRGVVPYAQRVR